MAQIRTELQENGSYNVYTPYNKDFVRRIKGIGGTRWNPNARAWNVPAAGIETARGIMVDIYGESDIPAEQKMVTIRVKFADEYVEYCAGVSAFGKTLAYARGRDSGACVGDDVILETGTIGSGGSAKNWMTVIGAGSSFLLTVPESIYLRDKDKWDTEIVENESSDSKRMALIAEREKLMARLAEIEKELGSI